MRKNSKIKILDDMGEWINKHSDGGRHYGWSDPVSQIPKEGDIIAYKQFDREGKGEVKYYRVVRIVHHCEEDVNHSYKGWVEVRVVKLEGVLI